MENISLEELKNYVERVESLTIQRKEQLEMINEVLGEASEKGFDKKAIRKIVALRIKGEPEEDEIFNLYKKLLMG